MAIVEVKLPNHSYQVLIEPGLLARLGDHVRAVAPHQRAALLADAAVIPFHGDAARQSLEAAGYSVVTQTIPSGERHKTLQTVSGLYEGLVAARLERKSPIVALGGGVTGDTAGFVAATYLRGVPFVQCPTTLLAMVDASVGGKVAVNLPAGKNLVGAFYQPSLVVIDTETLRTLPARELRCGLAECVKHAVIRDASLFDWIEHNLDRVLRLQSEALVELVRWNVAIKAKVVMADEKETGERTHLNFGHTFGHAIESLSARGPRPYEHGEAVALGMIAAAHLAVAAKRCPPQVLTRLRALLQRIGLPVRGQDLPATADLMAVMRVDKKMAGSKLRLVLPTTLGAVETTTAMNDQAIAEAWQAIRG